MPEFPYHQFRSQNITFTFQSRFKNQEEETETMDTKYHTEVPNMAVYNVHTDSYEEIDSSRLTPAPQAYHWDGYYASTSPNMSDAVSLVYSSPKSTTSDSPALASQERLGSLNRASSAPPKRKRENRYKDAPPSVLSRRRAQNRASQRAYRERKEQRIRDLEQLLEEAHRKQESLSQAFMALQADYDSLRAGQPSHHHDIHQSLHHQQPPPYAPVQPMVGLGLGHAGLDYVLPTTQAGAMMAPPLYATHAMAPYS
ncbi:AP-1-like transcription factor napA [Paramyrothecium foliicola]|nr:AP-1-like transcription factor napA [Paramyrothecium foliicola]